MLHSMIFWVGSHVWLSSVYVCCVKPVCSFLSFLVLFSLAVFVLFLLFELE